MIDPLALNKLLLSEDNHYNEKELFKNSKFGDVLTVTIQVNEGNLGHLQGAR